MNFKQWFQENFGPAHTGGMTPDKQIPFTKGDAQRRPNDPIGISGTTDDYPPTKGDGPTAKQDNREQEEQKGADAFNMRMMKKKMKKKP